MIIRLSEISFSYKSSLLGTVKTKVIKDLSMDIIQDEIIGIIGDSGCGKSTLAKLLVGLLETDSGHIDYFGDIKRENIKILFQNSNDILNPYRKIKSILNDSSNNDEEILKIFNELELNSSLLESFAFQLSGGEQQRIALARILLTNPKVLILDEPFSAQDPISQKNLISILNKIKDANNLTIIIISHIVEILNNFCERIALIKHGKVNFIERTSNLFNGSNKDFDEIIQAEKFNL